LTGRTVGPATIPALAAQYVDQIRRIQPFGPYRLLGWSFGGLVAHAMATQLESEGERVDLLAVLDAYPAGAAIIERVTDPSATPTGRRLAALLLEDVLADEAYPDDRARVLQALRAEVSAATGL